MPGKIIEEKVTQKDGEEHWGSGGTNLALRELFLGSAS